MASHYWQWSALWYLLFNIKPWQCMQTYSFVCSLIGWLGIPPFAVHLIRQCCALTWRPSSHVAAVRALWCPFSLVQQAKWASDLQAMTVRLALNETRHAAASLLTGSLHIDSIQRMHESSYLLGFGSGCIQLR